ncbi:MAG: tol-pal system protein YbgF [Hyphomonadaceae bacterium]|nr:tol-pal system protein YbgF [Hyphomonadaceae bacterium]
MERSHLSLTRLAALAVAAGFLFAAPASAQTQLPPPTFGQADARQDRIEELETQLRDATAENERLQYQLNQAEREITRLRGMVGELAGVNQSLSQGEPSPDAAAPQPPLSGGGESAPSGLNQAQRNSVGTLGTVPAGAVAQQRPPADPVAQYSQARELLVNGRYAEAEVAFGDFIETYPTDANAADARFWFAFTLLARNNYTDAAANFVQYLQTNANGPRAPEAHVRLGMALVGMGQTRQGCSAFAALPRRYPNAPRNVRDLAAREARAANCAA